MDRTWTTIAAEDTEDGPKRARIETEIGLLEWHPIPVADAPAAPAPAGPTAKTTKKAEQPPATVPARQNAAKPAAQPTVCGE